VAALAEGLLPFAMTRRAQVSVEHIVTLLRGPEAAANLPPMRDKLHSGAMLMAMSDGQPRVSLTPDGAAGQRPAGSAPEERSNPYAQTMVSPQGEHASRMAQTSPSVQMSNAAQALPPQAARTTASTTLPWIFACVLVIVGGLLAAFALSSRAHAPAGATPVPAAAPGK
jgi:hypothetical protein